MMESNSSPNSAGKRIGIAIVEHSGGYLVGVRGPDIPLAGYAEFPGGKCLPNESPEHCAVRECLEETHLKVVVDKLLTRCEFNYSHATVDLHFFLCHPVQESSVRDDHNGFRWVPRTELGGLKFPEANAAVVKLLSE